MDPDWNALVSALWPYNWRLVTYLNVDITHNTLTPLSNSSSWNQIRQSLHQKDGYIYLVLFPGIMTSNLSVVVKALGLSSDVNFYKES